MSNKLLPCPFCPHGEGVMSSTVAFYPRKYVLCDNCEALGPVGKTEEIAAKLWNTRSAKVGAWECRKIEETENG